MYEIRANTFFKGKFMCAPSFLVWAHLTTCSLEGTLDYRPTLHMLNCL